MKVAEHVDFNFVGMTAKAFAEAEGMLVRDTTFHAQPTINAAGNPAIGFERDLLKFPLGRKAGLFLLKDQLVHARSEMHVCFQEVYYSPAGLTPARAAILLVLAAIVGVEKMVDWHPLWEALKAGDYPRAAYEVACCNAEKVLGETPENKMRVMRMAAVLSTGYSPEAQS